MSIRNLRNENINTDINCKNFATTQGECKVKTADGLNSINYQTPNVGSAGYVLTVDANGNTTWTAGGGGGGGVSNPMTSNLDAGGFNIVNVPTLQNTGDMTVFPTGNLLLTSGNELKLGSGFATKVSINGTDTKLLGNNIDCDNKEIFSVNRLHCDNLTSSATADLTMDVNIDMNNNNINACGIIDTLNIGHITNPAIPMSVTTNTDFGSNNITGVNLLQSTQISATGASIGNLEVIGDITTATGDVTMGDNLDINGFNVLNVNTLFGVGTVFNNLTIGANNTSFLGGSMNQINNIETSSISTDILASGVATAIDVQGDMNHNLNNVSNINRLELKTLSGNGGTTMVLDSDVKCNSNNINDVSNIDVKSLGFTSGAIPMTITTDTQFNFSDLTQIQNLTALGIITANQLTTTSLTSNTGLNITATSGDITTIGGLNNRLYQPKMELGTSLPQTTTIHIFESSGFGGTVNVGGKLYHPLQINTDYIIHGTITLQAGLLFQINCSIKGSSISSKLVFDETLNDIVGFRSTDNNVYIQDLTIVGGGGHFSSTLAGNGLFLCEDYSLGAGPPFYGRDKRFRLVNCNIIAPFSLGQILGYSTLNINNNVISGGGNDPLSGIYTNQGLITGDSLSLEMNNNKIVLFKGAVTFSNTFLLRIISIDPLLGFNAVNISGNIIHPRSDEVGIDFQEGSITKLGLISANTIIRTGGTGKLINYPNNTQFDNYNAKEILNYEIIGNAGVINGEAILQASTGLHNSLSSATFIDLDIPITSINALTKTKRFSMLFVATGVSPTSGYTAGNLIQSQTDNTKQAYIQEAITILGGTQFIWLNDMTGIFPDLLGYQEVDLTGTLTGITSTGLQIGNNSGNLEFKMIDKDPVDLQFNVQITYQNNGADDEVQFRMLKDDQAGTGYVPINQSLISHTISRANRSDTATMCFIERFNSGETLKLEYRYIDATTSTIQSLEISAK